MAHQSRSFWMNPSGHRRILPSKISGRTTPTINRCHWVQLCSTNSLFSVRCWLTWIRICFPQFRSLIGPNGRSRRLWIQDPSGQTRGKDRTVTGRSAFILFVLFPMTGSHKRQIVDSARLDFCSLFYIFICWKMFCYLLFCLLSCGQVVLHPRSFRFDRARYTYRNSPPPILAPADHLQTCECFIVETKRMTNAKQK